MGAPAEDTTGEKKGAAGEKKFAAGEATAAAAGKEAKKALRVGGVPEHFNAPFHYAMKRGLYEPALGTSVAWTTFPGGTGAMAAALEAKNINKNTGKSDKKF